MRITMKKSAFLAMMLCGAMMVSATSAYSETVRRTVTSNADGSVTMEKTVRHHNIDGSVSTTSRMTTTDPVMSDPYYYEPAAGAYSETYIDNSAPGTTVTKTVRTETYSTPVAYDDEEYFLPSDRRVGQTYPIGEDHQGNNVLRYENKTHDGYNN